MRMVDSHRFAVVPIAGIALTRARLDINAQRNPDAVRQSESSSETFLTLNAGVGLILGDRLSITPRVELPVHSHVATRQVQVMGIVTIGQKR